MNKRFSKILMIITLVLALIGAVLYYLSSDGADVAMGNYVGYAFLLLLVAAGLSIIFSLLNMVKKPALLKKALLSLGVMAIVLAIAYFLADGNAVYDASGKVFEGSEGGISKWVGTFINYSLILLAVGAVLFLFDMIKNLVK